MMLVKTRFAPSPTGYLHVGGVRTILYNYLFARKNKGKFVLRIEDTDKQRSTKEFEQDIIDNLKWLGFQWDEFYRQSERKQIYAKYLRELIKAKKAFYCEHTKNELAQERQQLKLEGKPQVHWCFNKKYDIENRKLASSGGVIRLAVEQGIDIKFNDLIRGEVSINTDTIGNYVIAKSLDQPLYNFAAAIDDFQTNITHIIRGEEHIANTPKQILIYRALKAAPPQFAHLPLILGQDRSKLSKRQGATAIKQFKEDGYLPQALLNFLLLLGWHPIDNKEIFNWQEMIETFSLERVQKSPAIFDLKKLNNINSYYLKALSDENFARLCLPYLINSGLITNEEAQNRWDEIVKIVALEKTRIKILCDISQGVASLIKDPPNYDSRLLLWKNQTKEEAVLILKKIRETLENLSDFNYETIQSVLDEIAKEIGNKGFVFWPLRVALSGQDKSPSPAEIASALGKQKTMARIGAAIKKLEIK